MIKTIIRAMYSAFILIVLILIVLGGWTSYTFISQSSKSNEITNVIKDIYRNQRAVVNGVIDLSKILIKDKDESIDDENIKFLAEAELLSEPGEVSQLEELSITEDNGDNPLGIVIEPSLPEIGSSKLPDIREDPLVDKLIDFPILEMQKEMDMD